MKTLEEKKIDNLPMDFELVFVYVKNFKFEEFEL